MKSYKNLFDDFVSFKNLMVAFKKAYRASKTDESHRFSFFLENYLIELQQKLLSKSYCPKPYFYFKIFEPKERIISIASFEDRVVHHAIVNIIEPIFEKHFIFHSYATRKNKGTHKAIFTAQKFLRKNFFYLKCDISKFFYNIDHDILLSKISKLIADKLLLDVIKKIIDNAATNCDEFLYPQNIDCPNKVGLPIGNLTSQFFANVYLNDFDHFVKRQLKQKFYIRYMDDFVIFSNSKDQLMVVLNNIRLFLKNQLKLELKQNAILINTRLHGLSFLGTRIFPKTIRMRRQNLLFSLKKLKYKYYLLKRGYISKDEFLISASSVFAHIKKYNTYNLIRKLPFFYDEL